MVRPRLRRVLDPGDVSADPHRAHLEPAQARGPRRHPRGPAAHGHADAGSEAVVEELFICAPPERIVNDSSACQGGIFKIGAVKRNILRDAVNDHGIITGFALDHLVNGHGLRHDVLFFSCIDPFDEGRREAVFFSI